MTVTVEHLPTAYSGLGVTPHYRCGCGLLHATPQAAHDCRHRLRPVPLSMPDRHEPAQLTLEVTDD